MVSTAPRTRSGHPRRPSDLYQTPAAAVVPLIPYLPERATWWEPCAGDGALIAALSEHWPAGVSVDPIDVSPQAPGIGHGDALTAACPAGASVIITNPPWPHPSKHGDPAAGILDALSRQRPTWALLPWSAAANVWWARRLGARCSMAVPIGRPSWMGNGVSGNHDAGWFRLDVRHVGPAVLCPRRPSHALQAGKRSEAAP